MNCGHADCETENSGNNDSYFWTTRTFLFSLRFTVLVFFEVLCLFPARPYFKLPLPVFINLFDAAFFVFMPLLTMLKNGNMDPTWACFFSVISLVAEKTIDLRWVPVGGILVHGTNLIPVKGLLNNVVLANPRVLPTICLRLRIVLEKLSMPEAARENISSIIGNWNCAIWVN